MSDRIRIGIGIPQLMTEADDADRLSRFVVSAEALGLDGLWTLDSTIGGPSARKPLADGLHLLSFAAALTSSIRLGIAVIVLPHRLPMLLAKELATIDRLSKGRLIVGVGVGSRDVITGLSAVSGFGPRAQVMEESIKLIRASWRRSDDRRAADTASVLVEPQPMRPGGPPIWVGGTHRQAIERAARLGDGWVGSGASSVEEFAAQVKVLRSSLDLRAEASPFTIAKRVYMSVDHNADRARELLSSRMDARYGRGAAQRSAIFGTEAECAAQLQLLASSGATEFIVDPVPPTLDQLGLVKSVADRLADEASLEGAAR